MKTHQHFVLLLLVSIFFLNQGYSQNKETYHIEIKTPDIEKYFIFISNSTDKKLEVLDTCVRQAEKNTCLFNLEKKFYRRGLYTLAKANRFRKDYSKDVFINVYLNHDTDMRFVMDTNNHTTSEKSSENVIFLKFITEILPQYKMIRYWNNTTIPEQQRRDSVYAIHKQIEKIFAYYNSIQPNDLYEVLYKLNQIATVLNQPKQKMSQPDSLNLIKYKKDFFWKNIPLTQEQTGTLPNFKEILDAYSTLFISENIKDIKTNFILPLITKSSKHNKGNIINYLLNKYGLQNRFPFQRADELMIYLNDSFISNPKITDTIIGVNLMVGNEINPYKRVLNGMVAPEIEALDTTKKIIKLSNLHAKYFLLAYWDPNCSHCKHQMPILDSILNTPQFKSKNILSIAIKTDGDRAAWLNFIEEKKMKNWLHLEDTKELRLQANQNGKNSFLYEYNINQTPLFFLLDEKKRIIAKHFLPTELKNFF